LKITVIKVKTKYWLPGTDYVREIVDALQEVLQDGDIVTVSEKAISTAKGTIIDESMARPGRLARVLSRFWMRKMWGGPLGKLTKLRKHTVARMKNFPLLEGAAHKQVALERVGFLQSLRHYSEGGIDASNLPFSYVCLPLEDPELTANSIRTALEAGGKHVSTLIVDGDTTYSNGNLHLAPRRVHIPGLIHMGGFLTFLVGRMLEYKSRSTPLASSGATLNPDFALTLANVSHRMRGHGAGRTVWDMAESLGVGLTEVTWEMLGLVDHYPIAILRVED